MQPFVNIGDLASMTAYEFETVCRSYTQYAYLYDHVGLCRILSKYKLYIDTRDASTGPHMIMDGYWETWLTQCLGRIVRPGDICVDIGANFGYYSILMSALAGDGGRTIAVEPNPAVCRLLRATAGINHPGFGVAEVALADKAGKINLTIPGEFSGDASIIERPPRGNTRSSRVRVEAISLDALLESMEVGRVNVIKMDAEGAEPLVFGGMVHTIESNPSLTIIMEYSPHLYPDPRSFTEMLFSKFIVHRAGDDLSPLSAGYIDQLIQLKDHVDLLLVRK